MFPHTVTVYRGTDADGYQITVLRGVLLAAAKAAVPNTQGYDGADEATLYVPLSVEAAQGAFSPEGDCFFVKGEAVEPGLERQEIEDKYSGVYTVTSVTLRDFGTEDMRHWEIGGA